MTRTEGSPYRAPTPPVYLPTTGRVEDLSDRERAVLELVAAGCNNLEIAERLFIGINTVKTYIRQVYRKIGARSRSQAVIWAVQHGLLNLPGVTVIVDQDAVAAAGVGASTLPD